MTTIRNTELFTRLFKVKSQGTQAIWDELCDYFGDDLERHIPDFFGGLSHIRYTKSGATFRDRGCNGKDNSFIIRKELN